MMFPKTKRVKDKKAIEQARKPYCEYCGRTGGIHVHHVSPVGYAKKGNDELSNLISLCINCHDKAHRGLISKERLKEIIGER